MGNRNQLDGTPVDAQIGVAMEMTVDSGGEVALDRVTSEPPATKFLPTPL
jgi:hypothetical protein